MSFEKRKAVNDRRICDCNVNLLQTMFGISGSIVYKVFPQLPLGQVTRKLKKWSFFNCVRFSILYVLV